MAALLDNLRALHACLKSDDPPGDAVKAHNIVGDVGHTCLQDVTERNIDFTCSLLFAKDMGVVVFLRGAVRYDEYQRAKVELLEALKTFTAKWPHKVLPYAVDIKDTCMALFVRDKYAKVKCAALNLLVEVLTHATVSKVAGELDVTKLIEKLFLELTVASKHPATVKQLIYHLLGLLTEIYPEDSVNYSERLVETFVRTMKKEMTSKTKKPEMPIIVGCLLGLSHYLVNFTQSAEEDAKYSFDIYKATKMAIAKDIQHSKYDMPRAGLYLFKRHGPQFNLYIIDDYEFLYETLNFWCSHRNKDMLHAGMSAMETFLKQVSEMLVARAKEGKKEGAIFKFFIQRFRSIMDNPESSSKEVSLAIKGYGLFAAPCKMFLSTNDVQFMFNEMMQRSDQIFFNETGTIDERVMSLPSFLDALASIIAQLDDISDTFASSLERLVVVLMENVPKINAKMHPACYIAIMRIFHALMPKGATFKTFLSRVVYQSLIRVCSHPIVIVTEDSGLEETPAEIALEEKAKISYRDYLDMWHQILDHTKFKILLLEGGTVDEQKLLTEVLYHELMSSTLKIIDRLDLGSQRNEDILETSEDSTSLSANISADPSSGLHAAKPKDFVIFINLVDFCRDLLPHRRIDLFKDWVFKFGHELILHSTRHPLVSGFYKLLSVCMTICAKTQYFKKIEDSGIVKNEDSMEVEFDVEEKMDLNHREACFLLFSKFTREVLTRMKQYKDDLLASCLTFILSLPYELVSAEIRGVVPALQLALRLGVSYLTLAIVGLDALENWTRHLPPDVIGPYYKVVLPCLDPYLRTGREKESDQTVSLVSKSSNKKSGRRKLPVKLLAQTRKDAAKGDETQLMKVQQRCVSLLGSLGGSINHNLVTSEADDIWKEAVAWDKDFKHLKFDMPFMDIKPVILFDSFLPRIAELATTSSDRQTKVAACELLHSLILYMVGRGAQKPTATDKRQSMESLYRKLLPIIITLACDVEQVAKQLFEPLLFQLIHWFTGNKKYESPETMAMLDTLIDGIVDPKDTARRDFSAKCIKEFLVWSIKQMSSKKLENSPFNIKSLLKRLYSLSRHPSAFKRLGSALAFNHIYTVFREEDSLINIFIFEILVNYLESLALAHNDDKSLGTVEQCQQALNHIERIIKQKHVMLSKPSRDRVKPRDWNEALLLVAVRWLIRQCGRPHTEARHAAMKLVCSFSPYIQNLKTPQAFFKQMLAESGPEYFIIRFEHGRYKSQAKSGLIQCQTMAKLGDHFTLKTALNWYDIVLASLDSYTWTFGQRLLTPSAIFIVSGNKGTAVFKVLNHFLEDLAHEDIAAAARLFTEDKHEEMFSPHEIEQYNRMKCTAIVRFLNFFTTMFQGHTVDSLKVVPTSFWSDSLWELIVKCLVQPASLGFNMADVDIMMNLPQQTMEVLSTIKILPQSITKGFKLKLQEKLKAGGKYDLGNELPTALRNFSDNQTDLLSLVKGLKQLQNLQLLMPVVPHLGDPNQFAARILQTVFKGMTVESEEGLCAVPFTPKNLELSNALLDLSFALGLKPKDIMDVLLDKTKIKLVGSNTSDHGALLFAVFGPSLNKHLVNMAKDMVPVLASHAKKEWSIVGGVLSGILDALSRDKHLRKREGSKVVGLVLKEWSKLQSWWEGNAATQETKSQALTVLTKAMVVDSKVVTDSTASHFPTVFDMYLNLLTDRSTSLAFKSRVLDLVAFFVAQPEANVKKLKTRLDRLVADNFPMKSSEFLVGSPKYSDYITALNKILAGLHISGSLMMLELVISIMCREAKHSHEEEIQNTFTLFIKRLPMDKHKTALDVSYGIFRKEGSFPNEIRRATLERVCLPMLRIVHRGALIEFFCDHIKEIMATIETRLNKVSEDAFSCQLISKMCSLELLEIMFSRLTKDDVCSKTSRINSVYKDNAVETGKELATAITKLSNQAKGEDCRGESMCVELRRQYHCAAFNTLIAVISCTQTDIKFYNGFLFNENITKGQFLLDNLVDPDRRYTFDVEMETPLARRKRFVSIRNEVRDGRRLEEDVPATRSVHYLASQYLADSSLGSDISQFDFANSVASATLVGSGSMSGVSRTASIRRTESDPSQEASVTVEDDYVEMEMDELNQHECMASMTALLQHMLRNEITPAVEKGVSPTSMPPWMDYLHKKIRSHATPSNTKLFLAKLIINTEEVFRPYAKFWLGPLVQIIVAGETKDPGIHYFIVDIVVTLLSWHTVAIPEDNSVERSMASALLEFLLKNCHHDTKRILRNNLDVLKTLVEVWKDRLTVPYQVIYENFSKPDKGTANMTGIQMLGVILTNKLPPYSPTCSATKDRFFQHLAMNMTNTHKPVHSAASEVVGMALKYLSEKEKDEDSVTWREMYMTNISAMLSNMQQAKPDIFINCVHGMQRHHPPAVDKYVSKVLFLLPRLHGDFRTNCLEIILSRADHIDNIYTELKSKDLESILMHRDDGCQLVGLKLLHSVMAKLKANELLTFLPAITSFSKHPSEECRAKMYDILMWIYDNYREENTEAGDKIMTAAKEGLLSGLSDDDLKNRLTVQNFWSHETRLPTATIDRMVAMLEAMYSPSAEDQYLAYATNLLLEMTSKSPDYNRPIYEHPLSECRFEDVQVMSSWRQRHAAMTPLFVATQLSQPHSDSSSFDDSMAGQVRATQDVANFTPTQAAGDSKGPYNWLTQSSLDTFSDHLLTLPTTQESQTSLLFTIGKPPTKPLRRKGPGPSFGKGKLGGDEVDGKQGEQSEGSDIMRLKKRFLKDQDSSLYFAKRNARMKKLREDLKKEQKTRRENTVTMYRRYRIGDFPDIQINFSYIIAPLQALAQRDKQVARLLFGSLFKSIFPEIEKVKTEREAREMITQISESLNAMLANSTQYSPAFIACVLDIALEFPRRLKLEAGNVNTACVTSQQQPLGIILLEEMLHGGGEELEERPTKRARYGTQSAATAVSKDTTMWIELARMYKSLNSYDELRGIFSSKVGTQQITMDALQAEMRTDYKAALKLYTEGLEQTDWEDEPPNEAEKDLWDTSRLECCARLCDWSDLQLFTGTSIDDHDPPNLSKLWDDTYYQEHYLPHLIQGRLKLMLEAEDQQALLTFVDEALQVPERKALLETSYPGELALMYVWQEDYDRARHYSNLALQAFLEEWSTLNSLMESSRASSLQNLQKLTELGEFLAFMGRESNFSSSGPANRLIQQWLHRSPDAIIDTTSTWDDIVTNRCVYLDHISSRLELAEVKVEPETSGHDPWNRHKVSLWLSQADSACKQDNFPVALKQIKKALKVKKSLKDDEVEIQWAHTYSSIHIRRAEMLLIQSTDKIKAITTALDQLDKHNENKLLAQNYRLARVHNMLKGAGILRLTTILRQDLNPANLEPDLARKVKAVAKDNDKVIEGLVEQGYQHLKLAVGISQHEDLGTSSATDVDGINQAHMAFVRYCDEYLHQVEDGKKGAVKCSSFDKFHVALVTSLLTAMKNNSMDARKRFPRLLQIVAAHRDVIDIFIKKSGEIPCWMFLGWVGQLTAVLDKPESPAVFAILLDIATTYPQALIYSFKLSDEGYNFASNQVGKKGKDVRDRLSTILSKNKLVNALISALEQFGQPDAIFSDWKNEMISLLHAKQGQRDVNKIKNEFKRMYEDLMDLTSSSEEELYDTQSTASTVPSKIGMGMYRKRFAKEYGARVEKMCGKDGRKLVDLSFKMFREEIQSIVVAMAKFSGAQTPTNMKEYSQWLSDFQAANYDSDMELPGQYTGLCKPQPEYHVKINSFDDKVLVMSSIRKPKRITIRGNDEKDYMFLVKGGEDLRQDQRIEQLFAIMNDVMMQDATCRQQKYHLRTYQVIAMTTRVGMIEWMKGTIPLKDFLFDAMTKQEKDFADSVKGPAHDLRKFLGGNDAKNYFNSYKVHSRSDTVTAFRRREEMVPWDLSRRAYKRLSSSQEAYFSLRNKFATTHALVSICQYILGIGDRHLSNFMIDLETGGMVGIDFGHAFGSATQFLPIPELMPFRLTRQIRNLLLPLREKGLMEGTMIHALRALRNNSDLLMATMDVFIKEPSLDWQQNADKERRNQESKDDSDLDTNWYPREKVDIARKKLQGHHPSYIMREELSLGHKRKPYFKDIAAVLMGDKKFDTRARLPDSNLTVEQQVACLLNQASDPNILGRVWAGWNSWV